MQKLKKQLHSLASPQKAKLLQGFFKTGPGQYGEGDIFIGVTMPQIRNLAKQHLQLTPAQLKPLLQAKIHEERMLALVILTLQFRRFAEHRPLIYKFYVNNRKHINNWDLVDVTAPTIMGGYLYNQDRRILLKMSRSKNLWERRISIISTMYFIREHDFALSLQLAKILLDDEHDLIHKAVGWTLREVGKKDQAQLLTFLDKYAAKMPRVMLRYSIEKLSLKLRLHYLKST